MGGWREGGKRGVWVGAGRVGGNGARTGQRARAARAAGGGTPRAHRVAANRVPYYVHALLQARQRAKAQRLHALPVLVVVDWRRWWWSWVGVGVGRRVGAQAASQRASPHVLLHAPPPPPPPPPPTHEHAPPPCRHLPVSSAMSHSVPTASTRARNLRSSPRFFTLTCRARARRGGGGVSTWARARGEPAPLTPQPPHWFTPPLSHAPCCHAPCCPPPARPPTCLAVEFDAVGVGEQPAVALRGDDHEPRGGGGVLALALPGQRVVGLAVGAVDLGHRVHHLRLREGAGRRGEG